MNLTRRGFLKAGALAAAGLAAPVLPAGAAGDAPASQPVSRGLSAPPPTARCRTPKRPEPGLVRGALRRRALGGPALAAPAGPRPPGPARWTAPPPAPWPLQPCNGMAAGTEDCLKLDIYAPDGASGLPVAVYFHGRGQPHRHHSGAARPPPAEQAGLRLCFGGVPAGAAGLQRPARPSERPRRHRQLCPAGRRQGAGLGAGEHRRVRLGTAGTSPPWAFRLGGRDVLAMLASPYFAGRSTKPSPSRAG